MSKEELLVVLEDCAKDSDKEAAHVRADDALLNFINDDEIRQAFDAVKGWYA